MSSTSHHMMRSREWAHQSKIVQVHFRCSLIKLVKLLVTFKYSFFISTIEDGRILRLHPKGTMFTFCRHRNSGIFEFQTQTVRSLWALSFGLEKETKHCESSKRFENVAFRTFGARQGFQRFTGRSKRSKTDRKKPRGPKKEFFMSFEYWKREFGNMKKFPKSVLFRSYTFSSQKGSWRGLFIPWTTSLTVLLVASQKGNS